MSPKHPQRSVVVVDLSRYSDIARDLEQQLGTSAVVSLNGQIHEMIAAAVDAAHVNEKKAFIKPTGDGAILVLRSPADASRLAAALHTIAKDYNHGKDVILAQRHYRIGICTGPVASQQPHPTRMRKTLKDVAGLTISNAVRFEAACRTGEVLIDSGTWANLPKPIKNLYGPEEQIKGKRDEVFRAHRRVVAAPAPWDSVEAHRLPVPKSPPDSGEAEHIRELMNIQNRVVHHLEKQASLMGAYCPPYIVIQLEEARRTVAELAARFKATL
ncbi:MAG: hypothetical protein ABSE56_09880 [Bryobacteraceae bacterium]|jgi:class 3 adenylate cyclase